MTYSLATGFEGSISIGGGGGGGGGGGARNVREDGPWPTHLERKYTRYLINYTGFHSHNYVYT